jgi:hypothetical protein
MELFRRMRCCGHAVRIHAFLNLLPDVVAGFERRLQEEAGLVGDVLEVTDEGRTVFTGPEMLDQSGIFGNAIAAGGEEVWELLLKVSAGDSGRGFRIGILRSH